MKLVVVTQAFGALSWQYTEAALPKNGRSQHIHRVPLQPAQAMGQATKNPTTWSKPYLSSMPPRFMLYQPLMSYQGELTETNWMKQLVAGDLNAVGLTIPGLHEPPRWIPGCL